MSRRLRRSHQGRMTSRPRSCGKSKAAKAFTLPARAGHLEHRVDSLMCPSSATASPSTTETSEGHQVIAFFDESGHSSATEFFAVAAFVGKGVDWLEFDRLWREAL